MILHVGARYYDPARPSVSERVLQLVAPLEESLEESLEGLQVRVYRARER